MASVNERGLYPVVSMTDGTVRSKGWLELGGWRLGIETEQGAYFYYAHLDSYAQIEEGDAVKAGDLLGYMGDTGYSTVEVPQETFRCTCTWGSTSIPAAGRSVWIPMEY